MKMMNTDDEKQSKKRMMPAEPYEPGTAKETRFRADCPSKWPDRPTLPLILLSNRLLCTHPGKKAQRGGG